jgi:hypothetical protein
MEAPDVHLPGIPCHLVRRVAVPGGEVLVWADGKATRHVEGEREDWCALPHRPAWQMTQEPLFPAAPVSE